MFASTKSLDSCIKLASDATAQATAKGDIHIISSDGKSEKNLKLVSGMCVTSLRTNLLSVANMVDKNYNVTFPREHAFIKDANGNIRLKADRVGDLFYLREGQSVASAASHTSSDNFNEWHRRLGHLNWKDMQLMRKNESALGRKYKSSDAIIPCDTCATSKLSALPFPQSEDRSPHLLGIVHTGVCGPMRTSSQGGARYFLTFTDEHSRWTEVYFLKSKSDVTAKFLEYKAYAENQTCMKIRALQSDNGTEFCNSDMDKILKDAGIMRRLTTPYTPQQNGIAERENRTLVEAARCLLNESGVPDSLWA